ncbi:metaxin-2 isoform X1 [Megalopta genalis]|uniref:metaxin-2 isoform X1 n=1 Tax=Megalopta genalis TaxID=115081 RepID=UPI0014431F62|nr:metaxin-2-like isoform X1 [Megalopta genalis]XP_033335876.1 metaxin-2-like isoform X1 [Megalopta genalis]
MPSDLLEDTINMELEAKETLPDVIPLYQPFTVEQMLLPDNANCLAVEVFLKMCDFTVEIISKHNAEYMSPTGRVPFIKCGSLVQSEFDRIVSFIESKGKSLSNDLSASSKADMRAYMSLVNNVLVNAELYICWVHEDTFNKVTKERHGSVYPWPLNHFLNWQKRNEVIKKLNVLSWYSKSIQEVCTEVENCCKALSERLDDKEYFSGGKPTEVDALVFGHIHALLTVHSSPCVQNIATIIKRFPKLINHAKRIEDNYFEEAFNEITEDFEIISTPSKDTFWNSESLESLPPLSEDSFEL